MNQDELIALRKKILDDVMPLAIESVDNTPDRFELLLRIIQSGNANASLYQKAYDVAKSIEDKEEQMNALLSIVDEIDIDIQSKEEQDNAPMSPEPVQIPVDSQDN